MTKHRSPHDARRRPSHWHGRGFGLRLGERLGNPLGPGAEHAQESRQTNRLRQLCNKDTADSAAERTDRPGVEDRRNDAAPGQRRPDDGHPTQLSPPTPPLQAIPSTACNPETPIATLWEFARLHPQLRMWIVANPAAPPELMEYLSQQGGPGVAHALSVLLDSLEYGSMTKTD